MSYIAARRQEEKERRRGEILDAAEQVAAARGWDAMTMDQVARKARLSRALLYVYFRDKEDLMEGLCERALLVLKQRFAECLARHRSGIDQVEAMGRAYLAFSQEFPVYFEIMSRRELSSPEPSKLSPNERVCLRVGEEIQDILVTAIENGIRDGSIEPDLGDPREIAVVLWAFTHGIIQLTTNKANILAHRGLSAAGLAQMAMKMGRTSLVPRS